MDVICSTFLFKAGEAQGHHSNHISHPSFVAFLHSKIMSSKGFGLVIAVTFTLNYIIGTGFLTLPWAFYASGDMLATVVLLFVTLLAACSVLMILEAMARAAAVSSESRHHHRVHSHQSYSSIPTRAGANAAKEAGKKRQLEGDEDVLWEVGERRIEIVELCERFYPSGRSYFIFILSIYLYGALWAYATVFANALSTTSPLFGEVYSYYFYVFIYALVVVPMSCLELSEQVSIQVFYAGCRVAMVVAMLGTVAYAIHETGSTYDEMDLTSTSEHDSHNTSQDTFPDLVKWSGFKIIVPIALYSNIFHHSLPALSEIVADKKQLGMVFLSTLIICFSAYTIIGVTLSSYFGAHILSSSNLNWAEFYNKNQNSIVSVISNYIILFPAVDVMSAFPLSAITLGNNIHAFSVPFLDTHTHSGGETEPDTDTDTDIETRGDSAGMQPASSRREVIWYRCVGSIPPLLGACVVRDLGVITKYTGITGFAIIFFYPALLSYLSQCSLLDKGLNPRTYYTCALTSDACRVLLVVFGIFMVCLTLFT